MALSRASRFPEALATVRTIPLSASQVIGPSLLSRKKHPLHVPEIRSQSPSTNQVATNGASCGFSTPMQIRFYHTDVASFPDFSKYRTSTNKNPTEQTSETDLNRKMFSYCMMFVGAVGLTTGAKYTVKSFIMPLGPTAKTLAESSAEISLSSIPEGKNLVIKWRNKPLFIRHRTEDEISRERSVPLSQLRDPERDEDRVQQDKWLICLGVCTHLGCVPIAHAGDFPGGYYCPCHGSHYDASGRIRKGPAPSNLEVPEYRFKDDSTVVVG